MAYDYDEEEKKARSTSPPSTTAGTSSAGSGGAAQIPAWTHGAGSRSPFEPGGKLALDPNFVNQMMKEEGRPVCQWLDQHTKELRAQSLSLPALMKRVLDNVPAANKLPGVQVVAIIREWARDCSINIPDISLMPGMGDATGSAASLPMTGSDLAASLKKLLNIPTDITIDDKTGKAVISTSGATIELRSRAGLKVGGSVDWNGKMGVAAAYSGLSLKGSLTAQQWDLQLSYTLGPAMPDLGSLAKIFQDGVQSLQETVSDIDKAGNIPAIKDAVSSHWDKVDKAVKTASQISKVKAGQLSIGGQVGAKGPTFGGGPQPPPAVEAKILVTWTF